MDRSSKHLVLIGLSGSGKSTVGPLIAERLNRPFVDTDTEIERRVGKTISEIFAHDGEPVFRAWEERIVRQILAAQEPAVVALGGGAVTQSSVRQELRVSSFQVYLRAEIRTLAERLEDDKTRPLLVAAPRDEQLRNLFDGRRVHYEQAELTVDIAGKTPSTIADEIVATYTSLC